MQRLIERADQEKRQQAETRIAAAGRGTMNYEWVRQMFVWTPLQRFYLSAYARSALASSLAIRTGRYRLLFDGEPPREPLGH